MSFFQQTRRAKESLCHVQRFQLYDILEKWFNKISISQGWLDGCLRIERRFNVISVISQLGGRR